MKRGAALLLSLLMILLVQAPAFAGNEAEVCHTPGGNESKARTLRVNHHALPALTTVQSGKAGACGVVDEEPPEPPGDEEPPVENTAPVAVAAYSVNFFSITLDGTGSFDPDGDALTFLWEAVAADGTVVVIHDATGALVTAGAPYTVTLTVSDGELTDSETITIQ